MDRCRRNSRHFKLLGAGFLRADKRSCKRICGEWEDSNVTAIRQTSNRLHWKASGVAKRIVEFCHPWKRVSVSGLAGIIAGCPKSSGSLQLCPSRRAIAVSATPAPASGQGGERCHQTRHALFRCEAHSADLYSKLHAGPGNSPGSSPGDGSGRGSAGRYPWRGAWWRSGRTLGERSRNSGPAATSAPV